MGSVSPTPETCVSDFVSLRERARIEEDVVETVGVRLAIGDDRYRNLRHHSPDLSSGQRGFLDEGFSLREIQ
ncbi:hypothetical protein BRC77_06040 [Halobacteriales archaeon QH_8_64_26]|nr:MAG: hypothetical protein BRC77_06040 [Halobacteriales archaeon QH_8_64_26]